MTDEPETTETVPTKPASKPAELDEEAQAEYNAGAARLMQQVLAHQQLRHPNKELQDKLMQQYRAEISQMGMRASQKVEIRAKYRRLGLVI